MSGDRDLAAFACGCNWFAAILILFACCSPNWSWGWGYNVNSQGQTTSPYASVSTGPWIAGYLWSTMLTPCYPWYGAPVFYCWASFVTNPVYWDSIPSSQACNPDYAVYQYWSNPLGYCSQSANSTAPYGTFNVPSTIPAMQALIIIATIFVFFAACAGCADAGSEGGGKALGALAACSSFIAWIFTLAAFAQWINIEYVTSVQGSGGFFMPVWGFPTSTASQQLGTVPVTMWLGPGWACCLTGFIITFFTTLMHLATISGSARGNADGGPDKFASV